jgi:hypothetical protein
LCTKNQISVLVREQLEKQVDEEDGFQLRTADVKFGCLLGRKLLGRVLFDSKTMELGI